MRSKKTIINTIMSLTEELVAIICAFILPKLILSYFGSKYNGLTTSITQFLSCAILLRSGIGGATKAALYKPLANNNKKEIDSIIKATDNYMKRIGVILAILIIVFASIYPLLVKSEFTWFFTFSLFLIIGISTFAESFFGITYLILLQADQRLYISSIMRIIALIANVVIASILIVCGQSIHIVKLGSAIAFCIYPLLMNFYVRKKYKIEKNVEPNNKAIEQRWDAFWHQVTAFITDGTDIVVLTIFSNVLEVSVYSVYNLVISGLKRFIVSFTSGIDAAFGNMIAKNEKKTLKQNLSIIEMIVFNISTVMFTCAGILILQFISIYTKGITDVNYLRPSFAYVLIVAQFFYAIRLPYQFIVQAAGKFKETKKYAIIEAFLNVSISVILVIKFGLIGVAIGTLIALLYKTCIFAYYMSKKIIERSILVIIKKCIISFVESVIIIFIMKIINLKCELNYINWLINSIITLTISLIITSIGVFLFYKTDFLNMLKKLRLIKKSKENCNE